MEKDIFPEINIPVVSVIWQYTALDTTEMEQRFTTYSQYAISTNVSGIKLADLHGREAALTHPSARSPPRRSSK